MSHIFNILWAETLLIVIMVYNQHIIGVSPSELPNSMIINNRNILNTNIKTCCQTTKQLIKSDYIPVDLPSMKRDGMLKQKPIKPIDPQNTMPIIKSKVLEVVGDKPEQTIVLYPQRQEQTAELDNKTAVKELIGQSVSKEISKCQFDLTNLSLCSNKQQTYLFLYDDEYCKCGKTKLDISGVTDVELYSDDADDVDTDRDDTVTIEERFTKERTIISKYPRSITIRDNRDGKDELRSGYGGKCYFGIRTNMCYSVHTRPISTKGRRRGNGCRNEFVDDTGYHNEYKEINYEEYKSFRVESTKKFMDVPDMIEQVLGPETSPYSNKANCFWSFAKNNRFF